MSSGSQWGITMVYGGYAVTIIYHSSWFYKSTNVTQLGSPCTLPMVPPGSPTLPTLPVIQGPQTLLITEAACEIVFTTGVYLAGKQRVHRGRFASRLYGSPQKNIGVLLSGSWAESFAKFFWCFNLPNPVSQRFRSPFSKQLHDVTTHGGLAPFFGLPMDLQKICAAIAQHCENCEAGPDLVYCLYPFMITYHWFLLRG